MRSDTCVDDDINGAHEDQDNKLHKWEVVEECWCGNEYQSSEQRYREVVFRPSAPSIMNPLVHVLKLVLVLLLHQVVVVDLHPNCNPDWKQSEH